LTSVPFGWALEVNDEALFSAAVSEEVGGNETPSSTETVAGAWILDEVDGTSADTQLTPPTPEPLVLIAGMDCEPAPEKIKGNHIDIKKCRNYSSQTGIFYSNIK